GNRRRHIVLDFEDALELPVIAFSPHMSVGNRIDELGRYADTISGLANAALKYVLHVQRFSDLLNVHGFALVDEGRVAGDDEELAELRQGGNDILGQPVGKKFLLVIATHVGEGQNGDRRLVRVTDLRPRVRTLARISERLDTKDRDRIGNVLQLLRA